MAGNLDWVPLSFAEPNAVDIAACDLDFEVQADYGLHDIGHGDRKINTGTKAPEEGMRVTMVARLSSERTGTVTRVGLTDEFNGAEFENIMRIRWDGSIWTGDSGSPVLYEVRQGRRGP